MDRVLLHYLPEVITIVVCEYCAFQGVLITEYTLEREEVSVVTPFLTGYVIGTGDGILELYDHNFAFIRVFHLYYARITHIVILDTTQIGVGCDNRLISIFDTLTGTNNILECYLHDMALSSHGLVIACEDGLVLWNNSILTSLYRHHTIMKVVVRSDDTIVFSLNDSTIWCLSSSVYNPTRSFMCRRANKPAYIGRFT